MADEKVYSIRIDGVDNSITSINELDESVKTLEAKLGEAKIGSKEFKELQNQVKKSKSQLKDFELQVEGLDKEQRATALVDAFSGLTGAVGAASSAFIAFGASSETIENAEKKLLGVIGVVSGLRDASNGVIATQKLLGNVNIKEVATSFLTTAKAGMKSLTTLKGGVRALVGATGIGLLLVALSAVVENWEKIAGAIGLADSEQEKLVADAQENVSAQQQALDAISASENVLKLSGKSEREILQLKIAQTDEVISALQAQLTAQEELKNSQIAIAQRNKDILSGILNFLTFPLQLLAKSVDAVVNQFSSLTGFTSNLSGTIGGLTDSLAGAVFNPEKVAEEGDATIAETQKQLDALKNQRAGFQLSINTIDANAKKERDDKADADAKTNQDRIDAEVKNYKDAEQAKTEAQRELALKRLSDAKEIAKLELEQTQARLAEQLTAELEGENLTEEAKQAIRDKYKALEESATIDFNNRIAELDEEANQKKADSDREELERALATQQAKFDLASAGISAVSGLLDTFQSEDEKRNKKIFLANKAFAVSQAIIDTYSAVSGIFKNASLNPKSILFPAQPYIEAGIALVAGLTRVRQISQTQYESKNAPAGGGSGKPGGAGGGGGVFPRATTSSGISVGAPNIGGTIGGRNAGGNGGREQQPIQAYVLASDVVSSVDAREQINKRRTL